MRSRTLLTLSLVMTGMSAGSELPRMGGDGDRDRGGLGVEGKEREYRAKAEKGNE